MRLIGFILCMFCQSVLAKQEVVLILPSQMDGGHTYYHELLYRSLTDIGYSVTIKVPQEHIPQKRSIKILENVVNNLKSANKICARIE